jgi:hypothetical protein
MGDLHLNNLAYLNIKEGGQGDENKEWRHKASLNRTRFSAIYFFILVIGGARARPGWSSFVS